jgi:hypothetical protein
MQVDIMALTKTCHSQKENRVSSRSCWSDQSAGNLTVTGTSATWNMMKSKNQSIDGFSLIKGTSIEQIQQLLYVSRTHLYPFERLSQRRNAATASIRTSKY